MRGVPRKIHFVGVGGVGMSGLAEILLNLGYDVSGSDLKASEITDRLEELGLVFYEGHDASHIENAEVVVVSAAVPKDNVEVVAARERGIPVRHRSDILADLIRLKPYAVVVAGAHGKTTTTSMISAILDHANFGATSIVGGILHRSGTNARWGTGDYLVAEADEHDGSFLRLRPTIAVVTNIDAEHLEYYGTLDQIKRAFVEFCNAVPFYGYVVLCADDPHSREIIPQLEPTVVTYGLSEDAMLRAREIECVVVQPQRRRLEQVTQLRTRFVVESRDARLGMVGTLGNIEVQTLGTHNVRNAVGACAVGLLLRLPFRQIASGLRGFDGVQRRLQLRGVRRGILVFEDYAHHPTEIVSTLEAVRWTEPKRVIVIFQPHLYSRTKFFSTEFAQALAQSDHAIVVDIYGAREEPQPGVDAGLIVDAAHALGVRHVELVRDMYAVPAYLAPRLEEGDVVLILGAGNITRITPLLLEACGK